ncbi:MFS transporter [Haloprofundus sp. MHR1]|uniref:MFS transporter n=1 Tax=Haloprofundus sp. MHR1 TaxID=2572921 RepID=UPI0010BE3C50|nr:MFS transporter [Haloprofundus sp. MHR1]QCJ46926.1 MFS transporter [Haloprofundus sp. MHR1]
MYRRLRSLARFDALVLTALLWFLAKFVRYAFPPLFGTFQAEYGVSNAVVGTAYTALMLVYAVMQFPSGALADRVGAVTVITAGAVVTAVGALALVPSVPFALVVVAMLLVGLGTGVHKTVAVRLLSQVYPAQTGRALGALDTLGAFGGVAAPAAVVALSTGAYTDWHAVFLLGGGVGVALAGAFALRVPKRVPDSRNVAADRGAGVREYAALFRRPRFFVFVLVTVCFSFAYNGVVSFLPLYLEQSAGLSTVTANSIYSVLFVVSLVQLVTGEASDRVGKLPIVGFTLGLASLALVSLVTVGEATVPVLGVIVVALGLGSHGFRPVRGAYLVSVIPDSVAGGGLGAVRTLLMVAGALAPAAVGILSDVADFRVAFSVLAVSMAAAAALTGALVFVGDDADSRAAA